MDLGIVLIVAAALLCLGSVNVVATRSTMFLLMVALVLMCIGTYVTRMAPYIALIGVGLFVLSFARWLDSKMARVSARTGLIAFLAGLMVFLVGVFKSPTNDELVVEDRTGWKQPDDNEMKPQEILALDWSTHDRYSNWPVAKLMLDLCEIAYETPVDAREKITELGFDSESINAGSMQGYVIDAGDDSIIILRGTERHEYDIIQDLRFLQARTVQGSMHGGFVNGYLPMHSQVMKLLDRYQTKRVWITGHSLGGGLAIVCAHNILVDGKYPIAGIMTFGQPKVVREDMAAFLMRRLNGKYVFFVNDMDPVTRVVDPYVHFGHMVRWTDNDIERSRVVLMSQKTSEKPVNPNLEAESGYVKAMNDADLNEMVDTLEEAKKPKFDKDGNQLYQGFIPNIYDHFLSSYQEMLNKLRTHQPKK